jgi:hypothetical protein
MTLSSRIRMPSGSRDGGCRGGVGGRKYYQMARCLAWASPPNAHSILPGGTSSRGASYIHRFVLHSLYGDIEIEPEQWLLLKCLRRLRRLSGSRRG